MGSLWCGYCNMVYADKENCELCRGPLISLSAEKMTENGDWGVFCSQGENFSYTERELTIGRDEAASPFLAGNSFLSRQHVKLWAREGCVAVEDLSSENGTFVETGGKSGENWRRLAVGEILELEPGSWLLLAKESLCRVRLVWVPKRLCDKNIHRAKETIALPARGNIVLGSARVFCKNRFHFIENVAKEPGRVAINGRSVVIAPLKPGDRVSIDGAQYQYQTDSLFSAEPLFPPQIQLKNVSVGSRLQVSRLDLDAGEFVGVLGESGAGKSTLVQVISGWLSPDKGELKALIFNEPLDPKILRRHSVYLPQYDIVYDNLTVQNSLYYATFLRGGEGSSVARRQRITRILRQIGLFSHRESTIRSLSGGQRRRVNIAHELLEEKASLFILDEPTSGLDMANDRNIMQLLKLLSRQGRTIICITHNLANLDLLDRVILLKRGKVVDGAGVQFVQRFRLQAGKTDWSELYSESKDKVSGAMIEPRLLPPLSPRAWVLLRRRIEDFLRGGSSGALWMLLLIPLFIGLSLYLACPVAHDDEKRFFLCSVAAMWLGMSIASREMQKRRYRIFLHEKATGVPSTPYLIAFSVFYALISLVQTLLLASPCLYLLNQGIEDSYDQAFLFHAEKKYTQLLDQEAINWKLRNEFAEQGIKLYRPKVSVRGKGIRWLITDDRRMTSSLSAIKEGQTIGVYRTVSMEHLFDLNAKYCEQLDKGTFDRKLLQAFAKHDLNLVKAIVDKQDDEWLLKWEQHEKFEYFIVRQGERLCVYEREISRDRIYVFFLLVWVMGMTGTLLGLNLSLLESRFKMPASVTVPCLTVFQLLFSELVMVWLADHRQEYFLPIFDNLRDLCYCLSLSRYPDMAFRAYKNNYWQMCGDFYRNLSLFAVMALGAPMALLWVLIKTARPRR